MRAARSVPADGGRPICSRADWKEPPFYERCALLSCWEKYGSHFKITYITGKEDIFTYIQIRVVSIYIDIICLHVVYKKSDRVTYISYAYLFFFLCFCFSYVYFAYHVLIAPTSKACARDHYK